MPPGPPLQTTNEPRDQNARIRYPQLYTTKYFPSTFSSKFITIILYFFCVEEAPPRTITTDFLEAKVTSLPNPRQCYFIDFPRGGGFVLSCLCVSPRFFFPTRSASQGKRLPPFPRLCSPSPPDPGNRGGAWRPRRRPNGGQAPPSPPLSGTFYSDTIKSIWLVLSSDPIYFFLNQIQSLIFKCSVYANSPV